MPPPEGSGALTRTGTPSSGAAGARSDDPGAGLPSLDGLISGAGALLGQGFSGAVGALRDTHRVISGRVFWALAAAGDPVALATLPVRVLHDAITGLAYGLTGAVGETVARIGAELAALIAAGQQAGLRARVLLGVLNGMFGDRLAREGSPLALSMVARVDAAAPLTPRLVVFLHGLCETDDAWFLWRGRGPLYGERLRVALGYTPVYVRYNSGRPIADNGAELADLLEELVADAPVAIEEIALIGHSMGGLVAREALAALSARDSPLPVRHLISLGTPHRGARLEVAADAAARVMAWVPETRMLADALGLRSAGIQDLRHGAAERCAQDVDHYFFSAGLGRGLEPWLGDLLVHRHSAWDTGPGERVAFAADHYSHLGDATHFDLLGHPVIAEQIVRWLGRTRLLEAGAPQRP